MNLQLVKVTKMIFAKLIMKWAMPDADTFVLVVFCTLHRLCLLLYVYIEARTRTKKKKTALPEAGGFCAQVFKVIKKAVFVSGKITKKVHLMSDSVYFYGIQLIASKVLSNVFAKVVKKGMKSW